MNHRTEATIDAFFAALWHTFHEALEGGALPAVITGRFTNARFNPGTVIALAAQMYDLSSLDLINRARSKEVVEARALAVWALREVGEAWSFPAIGRALGGRDHTTILYLKRKADDLVLRSTRFHAACEDLFQHFTDAKEGLPS